MDVDLSVSDEGELKLLFMMIEWLLSTFSKVVDGESMEADDGRGVKVDDRVVRTTRLDSFKANNLLWR